MAAVTGRFAEARLYLIYCMALLHPGRALPTFAEFPDRTCDLDQHSDDELALLIEEGRRQLDRQITDLDRIRNRAGALATVSLALGAALATKASDVGQRHWILLALYVCSCTLAVLAVAGAASILSARAVFGRTDTYLATQGARPLRKSLAETYAELSGVGEETVRTFLTVFRDAVTLTVASALVSLPVLAGLAHDTNNTPAPKEQACRTSTTCSAPTSAK
ncbi:hypothetical protein OIE49_36660 [Streptomyces sp. NBC_01788]|uniref:hypothetical protein n=1 Tax=Streptomyces sp. NBC_01788 TaxID=2975940 RepID=UPI002DD8101E|nr:hypothetical protein [Streptomyces sp. NBC_01788]WSB30924.1 hypothetical protein OIE49_36660 [Streptomyces sp. NBC_01788]